MRNATLCALPDFRPGAPIVRQRIIGIGKLVKDDAPPFITHFFSEITRGFHAAGFRCQDELRTKRPHRLAAFDALIFRHDENHAITAHRRRHGQRNTGIPAGRLDQGVTRLDFAACLCTENH